MVLNSLMIRFEMDGAAKARLEFEDKQRQLLNLARELEAIEDVRPEILAASTVAELDAFQKTLSVKAKEAKSIETVRKECQVLERELGTLGESIPLQERHVISSESDVRRLTALRDKLGDLRDRTVLKNSLLARARDLSLDESVVIDINTANSLAKLEAIQESLTKLYQSRALIESLRAECREIDRDLFELDFKIDQSTRDVIAKSQDVERLTALRSDLEAKRKTLRLARDIKKVGIDVPKSLLQSVKANPGEDSFNVLERAIGELANQGAEDIDARELSAFIKAFNLPPDYENFVFLLMKRTYLQNGRNLLEAARTVLGDLGGAGTEEIGLVETLVGIRRALERGGGTKALPESAKEKPKKHKLEQEELA
jgi:hypothetical protein